MNYIPNFLVINVGRLAEAKKLLTEFFDSGDGEFDIFHWGWEIQKADENNLLDVLSHGPVIKVYCSDETFRRIEDYYRYLGVAA